MSNENIDSQSEYTWLGVDSKIVVFIVIVIVLGVNGPSVKSPSVSIKL